MIGNGRYDDPTTRYVPTRPSLLIKWCRLHMWHLVALAGMDRDPNALRAAPKLADEKYKLYCKEFEK